MHFDPELLELLGAGMQREAEMLLLRTVKILKVEHGGDDNSYPLQAPSPSPRFLFSTAVFEEVVKNGPVP